MDYGNLAQLGSFAVSVITLGFVITTYRSKAANDRVNGLALKIEQLEDATAELKGIVSHLPDTGSLHRMELAFKEMQGSVAVLAEKMKPIAATSERLQEFLVSQGETQKPPRRGGRSS